jgi:hypothetical protein
VNGSRARDLLALASHERSRLARHLLVAAALREVMSSEPIVVGGTAEEFWTAAEYHPTDLDLCAPLTERDRAALRTLGFSKEGRHWVHSDVEVAVEFPDARIDGDESRTREVRAGPGKARIIGLDDLYLDRLRQSTVSDHEGVEFYSALAVAAAAYENIDWPYVRARIKAIERTDPHVGQTMRRNDRTIRRRARQAME